MRQSAIFMVGRGWEGEGERVRLAGRGKGGEVGGEGGESGAGGRRGEAVMPVAAVRVRVAARAAAKRSRPCATSLVIGEVNFLCFFFSSFLLLPCLITSVLQ